VLFAIMKSSLTRKKITSWFDPIHSYTFMDQNDLGDMTQALRRWFLRSPLIKQKQQSVLFDTVSRLSWCQWIMVRG
jgi:hypothetical protein